MQVKYWEINQNSSPVLNFMITQPVKAQVKIQWVIDLFEDKGIVLLGTPFLEKLNEYDFYELRIKTCRLLYRIFVVIKNSTAWLIHAFIKKEQKTRINEIHTALRRKLLLEESLEYRFA